MPGEPLANYLRMHRRRAGLSQYEVAVLLGAERDTTVSRHESAKRLPSLEMALAYERLYGTPVSTLFPGVSALVETALGTRVATLLDELVKSGPDAGSARKVAVLSALAASDELVVVPVCPDSSSAR